VGAALLGVLGVGARPNDDAAYLVDVAGSATTEAPDEIARGDWLDLVARAGLAHTTAVTRYLAEGEARVEREAEAFDGWILRNVFRERPVLPVEEEEGEPGQGEPGAPGGEGGG
jgi:hypothetical protein